MQFNISQENKIETEKGELVVTIVPQIKEYFYPSINCYGNQFPAII